MVYTSLHFVCRGHLGKRSFCAVFDLLVVVWRGLLYCATYAWALVGFFMSCISVSTLCWQCAGLVVRLN